ncbi:hypothetical protein ACFWYW_06450 [Nonomuraea sp. NPDC059023]|uniref:hypothetical protein n=1 Tax=unclassified Nonomuraea TaxID=2593643 RepID=UPI0036892EA5
MSGREAFDLLRGPAPSGVRRLAGWAAVLLAGVVVSTVPAAELLRIVVLAVRSPALRRVVLILLPLLSVALGRLDDPANLPAAAACSVAVPAVTVWPARTAATAGLRS